MSRSFKKLRPPLLSQPTTRISNPYLSDLIRNVARREFEEEGRIALVQTDRSLDGVRARCAASLMGFMREAWHVLEPKTQFHEGWALRLMAAHLEAVTAGRTNRLLENVPPGMMKSLMTSVFWPAWEWGPKDMAWVRYLTTSYEETLAIRDNTKMRRLIESDWYQRHWGDRVQLTSDQNAKKKFDNTAGGGREGRAFISMTGGRGDRVIIDDPHSVTSAESPHQRAETVKLFREALSDRLNNEASAVVVIMQRLHEDDVSGVILAEELGYTHLCLPMEFEADRASTTPFGADRRMAEGELLFPELFSRTRVEELKKVKGTYAYAGQYQQRPAPREGGMLKPHWFERVKAVPVQANRVRRWDLAASEDSKGRDPDYTVGLLMARDRAGLFYIEDVVRGRWSAAEVEKIMKSTAEADKATYGMTLRTSWPQDPGQAGKAQAKHLSLMMAGHNIVVPERETGSKEVRATGMAAQAEAGNFRILDAAWTKGFLDEAGLFPMSGHDDQIDAASGAFHLLAAPNAQGWFDYYREEAEKLRAGRGT